MIIKLEYPDKQYVGRKDWKVYVDGINLQEATPQRNEVGYSWGYAGNGSHHLAMALLIDHFNYVEPNHPNMGENRNFYDFIATMASWIGENIFYKKNQNKGWKLSSSEVQNMILGYKKTLKHNKELRERWENLSPYFKAL